MSYRDLIVVDDNGNLVKNNATSSVTQRFIDQANGRFDYVAPIKIKTTTKENV